MPSQWERFKQSNIAKIVIGYSLVVWVLIQLIEAVLPTFETPLWVAQTLTFLLILGFPIALLVGWAYEKLPSRGSGNGEKEVEIQRAHSTPKRTLVLVGIGSCSVIGLFGFYMMPFIFDQAAFQTTSTFSPESPNISDRSFRSSLMLGSTGIRVVHNTKTDIAVTSDGTKLAYTSIRGDGEHVVTIKDLTQPNADREVGILDQTAGSGLLFFSQDEEWLHFISAGSLARVRIEGGSLQTVNSELSVLRSGFTSFGDKIVFSDSTDGRLYSIPVAGGEPSLLPSMMSDQSEGERIFSWPRVLPGNTHILVTSSNSENRVGLGNIEVHSLETGEVTTLIQSASNATYLNSGHIVFIRDADLWAVPFDLTGLNIVGSQAPVIEGIEVNSAYGHAAYAVTSSGRLFYLPGSDTGATLNAGNISWIDRNGSTTGAVADEGSFAHLRLSPDEELLAFTRYDQGDSSDIFVWEFERNTLGRRTFEGKASRPIWTHDGTRLIYSHEGEGLKSVAANGTELPETIFESRERVQPYAITSDGELVFDLGSPPKVFVLDLSDTLAGGQERGAVALDLAPVLPLFHGANVSPDGNWLAYVSNETGRNQVYVRPFPDITAGKWQASTEGGFSPIWNPDTGELFFFMGATQQYMVNYKEGPDNAAGKPNYIDFDAPLTLFNRVTSVTPLTQPIWAYSATRKNFLISEPPNSATDTVSNVLSQQTNLVVVDNIFGELQSLVPRTR